MVSTTKRIVVAFRLAGEPGRRKLEGFLRYMAERKLDWQLQFVRIREDFNAGFVKSVAERGIDGVVYSLPSAKDGAEELSRLDLPTVALDIFDDAILCGRRRNLVYIAGSCEDVGREAAMYRTTASRPRPDTEIARKDKTPRGDVRVASGDGVAAALGLT